MNKLRKGISIAIIAALLSIPFAASSCKGRQEAAVEKGRLKVVATLFPVYDFARNIGGDRADVTLLLPPGVEAHSYEPLPSAIVKINKADLFVYTGKHMEPWAEDILKGRDSVNLNVVDSSVGIAMMKDEMEHKHADHHKNEEMDPHIWLDFDNAQKMVDNILNGFLKADVSNSRYYTENAESYKMKLKGLDAKFKEGLSQCRINVFIHGGHSAFGYMARRYKLKFQTAYKGVSPDAEPTLKEMKAMIQQLRRYGIKHIFYEELISPRIAKTIASETGASLLKLHGAHNITKDEYERAVTFISLMEMNLSNLKTGLQCR